MQRMFVMECHIPVSGDLHQLSDTISKTKEPWETFLAALKEEGIDYQEVKGERRPRGPKTPAVTAPAAPTLAEAAE